MKKYIKMRLQLILSVTMFSVWMLMHYTGKAQDTSSKWHAKAQEALAYCTQNGLNTRWCVLVDMAIHSGKNRMVVYDFTTNQVVQTGLCSHGSCDGNGREGSYDTAQFSNQPNSFCSSMGKYKIGKRGYSNWGIHVNYKLHGLEATNNNAYKRIIVLHSWSYVPSEETYPAYAPNSLGCPMVSDEMMTDLDGRLKASELPVLLWIYKTN